MLCTSDKRRLVGWMGICAAALVTVQGCGPLDLIAPAAPLDAQISVTRDPAGGVYITRLTCAFEAVEVDGAGTGGDPVTIRVQWVALCGVHKTETYSFAGGQQTYVTTYSEAGGYYIDKTFWAEITWEDGQGVHRIRSASADCSAS